MKPLTLKNVYNCPFVWNAPFHLYSATNVINKWNQHYGEFNQGTAKQKLPEKQDGSPHMRNMCRVRHKSSLSQPKCHDYQVCPHVFGSVGGRKHICSSLWSRSVHTSQRYHQPNQNGLESKNVKPHVCGITSNRPSLTEFIRRDQQVADQDVLCSDSQPLPYISRDSVDGHNRKVHIETYGCQMNVNDTEIAWSILKNSGFQKADNVKDSDVVLLMTCSIREGAEQKIWRRLEHLRHLKQSRARSRPAMKIGILGCMAERLKSQILEKEKSVDVICGPDAYRDLPRLLSTADTGQAAVNVQLSLEETYADVAPVRLNANAPSAFVSIMRGCDNMCTYCVVPFTRGRERSRPISSIVEEVRALSDQGVREVTLLGQNVNSYRDLSEPVFASAVHVPAQEQDVSPVHGAQETPLTSRGFSTVYKPRHGGHRFSDLLDHVSVVDPEMRIRFTSPHPKDFPDEVLDLIAERPNICRQIHLPAQSGSTHMLEVMRRGYTREAYINLVYHIREIMPDVSLSSDFIAGFCGETEDDHQLTLSLMKLIKYNFAFCFPYSMRQKTRAYHRLNDDVPEEVKSLRHQELTATFRQEAEKVNEAQIGMTQLVLVEGPSKRSADDLAGRNEGNTKVIFPKEPVSITAGSSVTKRISVGDYVAVEISGSSSQVLRGRAIHHSGLVEFCHDYPLKDTSFAESGAMI